VNFELKVFRDDKAQPVAQEVVTEPYRTQADDLAKKHHLGEFFKETMRGEILYENGMVFVSPITDQGE
jgi:hypothetical protein